MSNTQAFSCDRGGFTLLEAIIGTAVVSMMFAALLSTSVSLQRSFAASDQYSTAKINQMRTIDYIARDLRSALTVDLLTGVDKKLRITLPDYHQSYDSRGNPTGAPVTPTLVGTTVDYGDPSKPLTVEYSIKGKSLIREVKVGRTNTTSRSVIGTGVSTFALAFGQLDSIVNVTLTFASSFKPGSNQLIESTKLSAAVSVRNVRRN